MLLFWLACVKIKEPAQACVKFCGVTTVHGLQLESSVVLKFIPLLKFSVIVPEFAGTN